jgi:repressor LexA
MSEPIHGLTLCQQQMMQIIQELFDANGIAPSYKEMSHELGLRSRASVHRVVMALEERGYITRLPHRARTIAIRQRVPMPDFTPFEWLPSPALARTEGVSHG